MNVDRSAAVAFMPACCVADVKWDLRIVCACAFRGSDGVIAMMMLTKSAIAASGCALVHRLTPAG